MFSKRRSHFLVMALGLVGGAMSAFAGTTTIDFTQGIGNLSGVGGGSFTVDENCNAVFNDPARFFLVPGNSSGIVSATIGITPAQIASGELGLVIANSADLTEYVEALVDNSGNVTLTGTASTSAQGTDEFPFPGAPNATMTLTYDFALDRATVTYGGSSSNVFINGFALSLDGVTSVRVGIVSRGSGPIRDFTATGNGVPDLTSTGTCPVAEGEGEGTIEGEGEGVEGEPAEYFVSISGPAGGNVEEGDTLRLTANVQNATPPVSFAWSKDGSPLSGETEAVITRVNVVPGDAGTYDVEVTDQSKATVSASFVVSVLAPGSLPVAGGLGLAALALITAAAGAATMRRRK